MKKYFFSLAAFLVLAAPSPFFAQDGDDHSATKTMDAPAASALAAEIMIGTGIENREPTGVSDTFPSTVEQLVGWTRVTGAQEPTEIRHVWKWNGEEVASVPLSVQSPSFRTHSRKTVSGQTGTWTLEVRDVEGRVIVSKSVEVTTASQ